MGVSMLKVIAAAFIVSYSTVAVCTQTKIDFARKIAEAMPPALPQSPVPKKPPNAWKDPDRKGKIKRIVGTSREAFSSDVITNYEEEIGRSGNSTRFVSYYEGFPSQVTVRGFVDGYLVSRTRLIEYSLEEKPEFKIRRGPDYPRNPRLPKDARFDERSVIDHDSQGRVTQWISYRNNGEEKIRMVFAYKENLREERTIWEGGDPDYRVSSAEEYKTHVIDKDGRIVESWSHGKNGEIIAKYRYTFELDARGNWITQRRYKVEEVDGKEVSKLLRISFRAITYWK